VDALTRKRLYDLEPLPSPLAQFKKSFGRINKKFGAAEAYVLETVNA
jgi:hypothetical protein